MRIECDDGVDQLLEFRGVYGCPCFVHALATSAVRDRLAGIGVDSGGDTPDQTQAFVLGEIERWARVIKQTGTTAH